MMDVQGLLVISVFFNFALLVRLFYRNKIIKEQQEHRKETDALVKDLNFQLDLKRGTTTYILQAIGELMDAIDREQKIVDYKLNQEERATR